MNVVVSVLAGVVSLVAIGCAVSVESTSAEGTASAQDTAQTVAKAVLQEMVRDGSLAGDCAKSSRDGEEVVSATLIDLNGDGQPEYEVSGNPGCACLGARRCAKWVYQRTPDGYRQILDMVQPDAGIGLRRTRTNGYADLEVVGWVGQEALREAFRFDGREYRSIGLTPL